MLCEFHLNFFFEKNGIQLKVDTSVLEPGGSHFLPMSHLGSPDFSLGHFLDT
jgi:hypothetical protein